jgi:hypothetical protein
MRGFLLLLAAALFCCFKKTPCTSSQALLSGLSGIYVGVDASVGRHSLLPGTVLMATISSSDATHFTCLLLLF